jgi:hypothetical protein
MQRYAAARLAAGYSNLIHTGGVQEDSNLLKTPFFGNFDPIGTNRSAVVSV